MYLRFSDHLWGHGLNNVLQEKLLYALISHHSNRSFVFEDFVWSHLPFPYTLYDFSLRPTRVPMSAFLGGWIVGGNKSSNFSVEKQNTGDSLRSAQTPAADLGSDASRSSPYSSHLLALPPPPSATADGVHILQWWVERLSRDDVKAAKCVVVRELERRVWDSDFFGSSRILSLFPLLQDSPVLRKFEWSPLVNGVVERSVSRLFRPSAQVRQPSVPGIPDFSSTFAKGTANRIFANDSMPGVLAVHLRRGDYKRHCVRLSNWGAGYMGWNRLVDGQAEDRLDFKAGLTAFPTYDTQESSHNTSANDQQKKDAYYLAHCLPTIPQIVSRLRQVRATYNPAPLPSNSGSTSGKQHHTLSQVYVLTNGWPSFVAELRTALLADGWERVVASVDLEDDDVDALIPGSQDTKLVSEQRKAIGLSTEEMGVSAAIDMGLAERAEVFVGNGFSSLSANVVMLRMAKGLPIHSNRLL
ncbi:hypothetical protein GALMADRAFT_118802 [Galerina marginata CBS 339.88]|uniref:Uncharacterized protein n=1 Tax=Galerina marginata (strain CBS 339.88) TaxID=685588 RepID=A0A067T438_GALM3|nr:hypothetical protein GALMADRAFT_118802 [Galerina marginata CBS 339.88]